jgi:CRISPR-associated protein Cmr1
MKIKKINGKIITPMLIHGEDTQVAELRPPSIKGAMRFWWRAIHGNLSLDELKKQETKLFGGAGESNALKSSFRIKLETTYLKSEQIDPLPHKKGGFKISGYKENQNFEISLIGKELAKVEKIFELTVILGGFGLRSRRGFGCVSMIKDNSTPITEEYIKGLIADINKEFKYTSTVQYPYIKEFKIGKTYRNFNDLQKVISKATSGKCGKHLFNDSRFSSPIYVSILKFNNNDYRPIITTLNCTSVKFKNKTKEEGLKVMNEFKKAIL